LTLIEFLVKNGSERVIEACRDKQYKIRSLENFNFYEGTVDRGSGVREKSKQIVELLGSNEMIREEREKSKKLRDKFVGIGNDGSRGSTGGGGGGNSYSGGGGNYGNSSDRGFGNSYSDSGSNNGGGNDSYSSNNGRESRYGNDNSGSVTWSNGRYSDEDYKYPTETVATKKKSYDDDEPEIKIKHKAATSKLAAPVNDVTIGGKLKLNIKKGSAGTIAPLRSVVKAAAPGPAIDLLGGGESDFVSAPAAIAPSADLFDSFSLAPQVPQSQQQDFGFATFGAAPQPPPVPQQAPAFDPFGMGNAPPQPQIQQTIPQQPHMQSPMQPQIQPQHPQIPPQIPYSQPQFQQQQQPSMQPQQGFGNFNTMQQAPQVPTSSPSAQMYGGMQSAPQQQFQLPPQQQHQQQQQHQPMNGQPMNGFAPSPPQPAPQQQPFRGLVKQPEPDYGNFESSSQQSSQVQA
jgi:hypothetical protein